MIFVKQCYFYVTAYISRDGYWEMYCVTAGLITCVGFYGNAYETRYVS